MRRKLRLKGNLKNDQVTKKGIPKLILLVLLLVIIVPMVVYLTIVSKRITMKIGEITNLENITEEYDCSANNKKIAIYNHNKIVSLEKGTSELTCQNQQKKIRYNVKVMYNDIDIEQKEMAIGDKIIIDTSNEIIVPDNDNIIIEGNEITVLSEGKLNIAVLENGKTFKIITVVVKETKASNALTNLNYGINVVNGEMLLGGSRFNLMGVNTFNLFSDVINNKKSIESVKKDIDFLAQKGVPFIRVPFCTWDDSGYKIYQENQAKYFEVMDAIVKYAEKKKIGLVIDFFWNDSTLFYYNKEQRADMGNVGSNSMKFARKYVEDIVKKYKNSLAIWGYEIGNEYNLDVDLYPTSSVNVKPSSSINGTNYNSKDFFTTNELITFYTEISKTIYSLDPYRFITNGDAAARAGAASLYGQTKNIYYSNHKSWDNKFDYTGSTEYMNMILKLSPSYINTTSFHLYNYDLERSIGGFDAYLKMYVNYARNNKKALYLGEFNGNTSMGDSESNFSKELFNQEITSIKNNSSIQLSSVWMWNREANDGSYIISNQAEKDRYRLEKIYEYNKNSQQVLVNYWGKNIEKGSNALLGLSDVSNVNSSNIVYSINNNTISVTSKANDGNGSTNGRVYLTAGKTYSFNVETNGIWGTTSGTDTVEAFLLLNGNYNSVIHLKQKSYTFTPQETGIYWLRLDVNMASKTYYFKNIEIKEIDTVASPNEYTIKFNANGGIGNMNNLKMVYGTSKNLTINTYTRTGYMFDGWSTSPSGAVVYKNGQSVNNLTTVNGGFVNLYAHWTSKKEYTIRFNTNGGVGSMGNLKMVYGTSKNLTINTYTRTGYTFDGWSTNPSGAVVYKNGQSVNNLTTVNGSVVNLYAHWTPKTMTITYKEEKFGTKSANKKGVKITYNQKNSYITLNGKQAGKIDLMLLTNQKFINNEKYVVTLNYISGSYTNKSGVRLVVEPKKNNGASMTTRNNVDVLLPTSTNRKYTATLTMSSTAAREGTTLYSWIWASKANDVKYNNYKIKISIVKTETKTGKYNTNYSLPSNPTRFGYAFNGWYTQENGGSKITNQVKITKFSNHDIYAHWR